ncbi:hydroxylacyl-CoA dehydrogenase [Chryseobacterium lactis]|uniref:Hydroxylacyl-CoA dehydrogenase n=1 Tax=Chryseobacterium lactis TaxID=1241981 RepID=A0A3G6RH86_CHRLC|nr:3-hydroxyacyl-CoA dehydrogenase NAD-binding domain-containing protein [Chryseobacterium lactis]AZA84026.1 hydroxylacyl-CoA dehydrogenase [Chryseobacterium lactis]AZB04412.1 hydroxylacyl-CoA dehydrogenase [Chryseobacterium lactis]PNW12581.1 hydroxylacyl-CoA dehydrogenase [Chryseobacterium lactis]
MKKQPQKLNLKGKKITVIGGGLIGASWASLFLTQGMNVAISDPKPDIQEYFYGKLDSNIADLKKLGYKIDPNYKSHLSFETDTATAVKGADYIQENGPENAAFKQDLWQLIEANAPEHALFLSSSSGITVSQQATKMKNPSRLLIGHPFNPPHLIPLVEILIGKETADSQKLIDAAMDFYHSLGKVPVLLHKETPGFVANRLQAAIFRECVSLVSAGVVNVKELDDIMTASLGIRWAVGGPFVSFHLGGGDGGFPFFLHHLGPGMEGIWKDEISKPVSYDEKTTQLLDQQVKEHYGNKTIAQLSEERDEYQIALMNTFSKMK